jgi:hypothetical protein
MFFFRASAGIYFSDVHRRAGERVALFSESHERSVAVPFVVDRIDDDIRIEEIRRHQPEVILFIRRSDSLRSFRTHFAEPCLSSGMIFVFPRVRSGFERCDLAIPHQLLFGGFFQEVPPLARANKPVNVLDQFLFQYDVSSLSHAT